MEISVKSVSRESRNYLEFRIEILVGDIAVDVVVFSYLHRITKGKAVKMPAHYARNSHKRSLSIWGNPILPDFPKGGRSLEPFSHFHLHEKHSQYLILSAGGYNVEIGFLLTFALKCFLDFKLSLAVGAGAFVGVTGHQPRMSAVHTSGATFRQAVGIVIDSDSECPTTGSGGDQREVWRFFSQKAKEYPGPHTLALPSKLKSVCWYCNETGDKTPHWGKRMTAY